VGALGPRTSLALAVFGVSWAGVLVKACAEPAPGSSPATIALWRVGLASFLLVPLATRPSGASATLSAPTVRLFGGRLLPVALLAAACLAFHFVTWFSAVIWTSVGRATVLVATQPFFAALLSPLLLKEKPRPVTFGATALAVLGVAILVGPDLRGGPRPLLGTLLAIFGAALSAAYLVLGRALRARIALARYLLLVNGSASLFLLGWIAVVEDRVLPARPLHYLWLALLAVGPHLLGHGLLNRAVREVRAYLVQIVVLGEPVLATFWAWAFLGERPSATLPIGGGLVVAGVIWALRGERAAS
jgi:drug/metabolite transporter (DMT)-like permease